MDGVCDVLLRSSENPKVLVLHGCSFLGGGGGGRLSSAKLVIVDFCCTLRLSEKCYNMQMITIFFN